MKLIKSPALRLLVAGLMALFVMASASVALAADPVTSTDAFYSVVHEPYGAPYAPFTDAKATSTVPFFSVVHVPYGVPYAPYTDLKATSTHSYYSVVHDPY